ncbi:MAG: hypothetical protein ACLVAW_01790 [Eisenbergiella massiliensis]
MENEAVKEIIKTKELTFDYIRHDEEGNEEGTIRAVDNVSLEVKQVILSPSWGTMVPASPRWQSTSSAAGAHLGNCLWTAG